MAVSLVYTPGFLKPRVRPSSTIAQALDFSWNPKAVWRKALKARQSPKWLGIRKKGGIMVAGDSPSLGWDRVDNRFEDICGGRKWKGIAVREKDSATSWSAWLNTLLPREVTWPVSTNTSVCGSSPHLEGLTASQAFAHLFSFCSLVPSSSSCPYSSFRTVPRHWLLSRKHSLVFPWLGEPSSTSTFPPLTEMMSIRSTHSVLLIYQSIIYLSLVTIFHLFNFHFQNLTLYLAYIWRAQ